MTEATKTPKSIAEIIKQRGLTPAKPISTNSIKIDLTWWDREGYNDDAIERYRQLYEDGTENPILIQKDSKLLIDGFHRIIAAREAKKDRVLAIELDVADHEIPLLQILANCRHGVPLSHTERDKAIIRSYVLGHYTQQEIAEITGLSQRRVSEILKVAKRKLEATGDIINIRSSSNINIPSIEGEDAGRVKEALLASYEDADKRTKVSQLQRMRIIEDQLSGNFTQAETAEKFGVNQSRISQIVREFRDEVADFYCYVDGANTGHSKEDTANHFSITKNQVDRLLLNMDSEPLNFKLPQTTWWPSLGLHSSQTKFPGAIPLDVVKSILALFTKPGSHIVDLMAGSGTVGLACKDMICRSYELFDLTPHRESLSLIKKHDLVGPNKSPVLPHAESVPDLVFLDPPYSRVAEGKYEGIPSDLATWAPEQFCQFMQSLIMEVLQTWKCKVVLLMSNLRTEGTIIDLPTKITHFLSQNKNYKILDHIVNEIGRPESIGGYWVASASKGRWLLRNHIHIIVVADNAKS